MIIPGEKRDIPALAALQSQLWPHHSAQELASEIAETMESPEAAFFLAVQEGVPVGFAQCQLRHDYVEGTQTSPVGYLEGIFVREDCRRRGYARQLLAACEGWAKEQSCGEFASDCELSNTGSFRFHLGLGFQEANRIICFTKKL